MIIPANPAIGILYVTRDSPDFISGHVRMRGRDNGRYPYKYLEMLENLFCHEPNTIEVCSNGVTATKDYGCCFTVDINPTTKPTMVCNAETLDSNFPSISGLIGTWSFLTLSLLNMSADCEESCSD
jgi:hypothetical protein